MTLVTNSIENAFKFQLRLDSTAFALTPTPATLDLVQKDNPARVSCGAIVRNNGVDYKMLSPTCVKAAVSSLSGVTPHLRLRLLLPGFEKMTQM